MVEIITTEFTLRTLLTTDWNRARAKIDEMLGALASLTIPLIGWGPTIATLNQISNNTALLTIVWKDTRVSATFEGGSGGVSVLSPVSVAFNPALLALLPQILAIVKSIVIGLMFVIGLKTITGETATTNTNSLIDDVLEAHANNQLPDSQVALGLSISRPLGLNLPGSKRRGLYSGSWRSCTASYLRWNRYRGLSVSYPSYKSRGR